ncbi:MAG: aldose 1-epimerase family protein [Oscillospiraceae bacterium]|nr:aldose 1-epimerase family protein [Oscillospiraceae bacterium]
MIYTIKNEYLTVSASDAGGELQSIRGRDGTEYLWQGDPAFWAGRAPNLFPYIARLTDETFTLEGQPYHMRRHGLVKYHTLTPELSSAGDSMAFRLESSEKTRAQYPFDFIYRIAYTLRGRTLAVTASVENTGSSRMYFALGGHPGFRVPLEDGLSFEDYYLEFDRPSHPYRVGFSDACFLTGHDTLYPLENDRRIPLHHDLFDHDAVILKHAPKAVTLASDRGGRSVTVRCPDFMYIGFWHPPGTAAPFVCIEPWSALPSRDGIIEELSCQSDLTGLDGGAVHQSTWTAELN